MYHMAGHRAVGPGAHGGEIAFEAGEPHELAYFRHPRPFARPLYGQMPAEPLGPIEAGVEMDHEAVRHHKPVGAVVDLAELQRVEGEPVALPTVDQRLDGLARDRGEQELRPHRISPSAT